MAMIRPPSTGLIANNIPRIINPINITDNTFISTPIE